MYLTEIQPAALEELTDIALSVVILTSSAVSFGIYLLRRRSGDRTLLYFSLFALLYGTRLLLHQSPVREAFGLDRAALSHVAWALTCVVALPLGLFLRELAKGAFRKIITVVLSLQALLAVVAIFEEFHGVSRTVLEAINSCLVLLLAIIVIALLLVPREDMKRGRDFTILRVGFGIFLLFVVHGNLVGLHIVPGPSLEPLGFIAGLLCVGYVSLHRAFDREEQLLAIRKEMEIAKSIQASLLPRSLPSMPGLAIAARFLPASDVAGDFYDFLVVDPERIGVLVADVSGHGVPSALIASMLKVAFASQRERAANPAQLLFTLNETLCGMFEEHYVTAAYVYFDLRSGEARYAGAGHTPLLHLHAEGSAEELVENGLPLGMIPEVPYPSRTISLRTGDRLLIYTDGVFEAKDKADEEFGRGRCAGLLRDTSAQPVEAAAEELLQRVKHWASLSEGHTFEDDFTAVLVEYRPGQSG